MMFWIGFLCGLVAFPVVMFLGYLVLAWRFIPDVLPEDAEERR